MLFQTDGKKTSQPEEDLWSKDKNLIKVNSQKESTSTSQQPAYGYENKTLKESCQSLTDFQKKLTLFNAG